MYEMAGLCVKYVLSFPDTVSILQVVEQIMLFCFSTPSLMHETSSYCTPSLAPGKVYLPSATAVAMNCHCWTQRNTLGKYR